MPARAPSSSNPGVLLQAIELVYAAAEDPQLTDRPGLSHLLREPRDTALRSSDESFVRAVAPHLRLAWRLRQRLHRAACVRTSMVDALNALPSAVFLVDAAAHVLLANRHGEALLAARDGLSADRGRLCGAAATDTKRLREARAAVADAGDGPSNGRGEAFSLTHRPSGRPPLQVLVTPTASAKTPEARDERVAALVCVSDPATLSRPSPGWLKQLFGLTPAECDVAGRLAIGQDLKEIARHRRTAVETVRRQHKCILANTGARRRSELVRLLSTAVADLPL